MAGLQLQKGQSMEVLRWQVTFPFLFYCLCHSVSGQIHYSINEELRKGSIVGNLAKDLQLDVKDLSGRKLRIESDVLEKYFTINLDNGNLYIADRIDRETLCGAVAECVLIFDAVVENPLNVFTVKIDIQDINDNPPKFLHSILTLEMSESSSPGRSFVLQKAEDLDIGINSLRSYKLSVNQYFALGEKISSDGSVFPELILEKPLDRETQDKHELILTAYDGGNPVKTDTALINIIITDFNDNSPVFTQDVYKVSVRENIPVNSTILQVSASDDDEGVNAKITYSISTTVDNILLAFQIDSQSGEIRTKGNLDYEVRKYYEISVQAQDGGGLAAHAKVLIEITDENDNAPEISIASSSNHIPENCDPGTMVALIKVHDRDSGENGEVQCLIKGDLPFELLSSTGKFYKIVTKSALDREKTSSYNITIQASDKGSPEITSEKVIQLSISDVNDNAPVFDKLIYSVFVTENNLLGSSIFSIQARDLDNEDNSKITYSIMTRDNEEDLLSSYISMNPVTGVIYAQQSFDYEKHTEFNIQILARDNGSPSLNSSTTLTIYIIDQNDNSPIILYPSPEVDRSVFEMVPWTTEQGSLVSKVVAVDADSGHNAWLSYFLQSSEPSLFTIDQQTGEIRTSRVFQERDIMKHGISILVKDNGIPSRSASVTINMVIADGFHQILPDLSSQSNKEESQSNLQFYLVIALALISFLFMMTVIIAFVSKYKESKSSTTFGSMSTNLYPPIDPRLISQFNNGTLTLPYSYDVCVTLDPSEQEFAFIKPQHNVPVDSLIDADDSGIGNEKVGDYLTEDNHKIQVSADGSVFPELKLEKPLDRETQEKHELILTASDGANPLQTGTALINIIITDFNDNSPVFTQDVYKVSVRENIPVNSTILKVSASDDDKGINAQITYSITQDGGGLAAHTKVLIEITDENDNAPEISITSSSDNIPEDSNPGTVVALIKVHDRDSGENGEVQCAIKGDLPFELISSTGKFYKIITKSALDREKTSSYNITIQASDKGSAEMSSRKVIQLSISDINENAPVFEKLLCSAFVTENNLPGASIFSIQARDMDSEDNSKITYFIMTKANKEDSLYYYISINPITGVIYAQQSFDYEKHKEFIIQIIARDSGSPSLNSSTTLKIYIVDQNDNSPIILYPSPEVDSSTFEMVPWTSEKGSLVSKVVAVDADSGHNGWLSYFLQSSEPSLFTIDQHTGEIRTSRLFQERDIMKHGIVVLVKDNGIPSHSASVTINMVIAGHFHQILPELSSQSNKEESQANLQFYLLSPNIKSKSSSRFGSMSTNLYPPVDPRFISQFNSGTLPLPYSYDVCVTLDPHDQEFAFLKPQHNVPVDSLIDADDSGIGNETIKNCSPVEILIPQL
ncbi:protocadherin gamma-B1-like [Bufo gargarizans]|uniref:protocadherin gamma-B1-like n=1 Tax=Bufo gargarizans TaxID=30331 RepID=UPI001CF4E020|nr:protocadherin gamma-B1-like [Bufo gargarizans]